MVRISNLELDVDDMLGIEDYGSDSDSGESPKVAPAPTVAQPAVPKAPRTTKKKIAIPLPSITSKDPDEPEDTVIDRPAKKQKTGAGASSLLSMLPAPKEKNPIPQNQPQRTLGSGAGPGLNFRSAPSTTTSSFTPIERDSEAHEKPVEPVVEDGAAFTSSTLFRPTSLAKGKKNISLEESFTPKPNPAPRQAAPTVDFFSLGKARAI